MTFSIMTPGHNDIQYNDTQHNSKHTTFSIMTLILTAKNTTISIMTLSITAKNTTIGIMTLNTMVLSTLMLSAIIA